MPPSSGSGQRANKVRGEVELVLDGTAYVLRPSYEAILAFEADTGRGKLDLMRRADAAQLTTSETASIVTRCIQAQGRETKDDMLAGVNARKIGELIMETAGGELLVNNRLALMLFGACTGGYTSAGEVKAAAEKATTTAA